MKNRDSESREQRAVKGARRVFGALAVFCLVFALAGCDTGSTGGGGGGGGGGGSAIPPPAPTPGPNDGPLFLGPQLQLSGSVHQESWDDNSVTIPFTGSVPNLSGGFWAWDGPTGQWIAAGGSGEVTSGQLSFSAGAPSMTMTMEGFFEGELFEDEAHFFFNNFTISNPNTGVAVINTLRAADGRELQMFRETATMFESVTFIYVASDVTVSGTGRSWAEGDLSVTTTTFSLNFQQGWNAFRFVLQENAAGTAERISFLPGTPALAMWVIFD